MGPTVAQIGMYDSNLAHVNESIARIRADLSKPIAIENLARKATMSSSTFQRHFRNVTGMTPLQFQKELRLYEARSLLLDSNHDVAGVAHLVGYNSSTQFNREYRRLFGAPPGQDVARLRAAVG
jgi:transcriptional regulator GlxA family with amidase domain